MGVWPETTRAATGCLGAASGGVGAGLECATSPTDSPHKTSRNCRGTPASVQQGKATSAGTTGTFTATSVHDEGWSTNARPESTTVDRSGAGGNTSRTNNRDATVPGGDTDATTGLFDTTSPVPRNTTSLRQQPGCQDDDDYSQGATGHAWDGLRNTADLPIPQPDTAGPQL